MALTRVTGAARLTDQVADLISEEIRSGRLTPGDKLPTEVELVKRLGVSRTVVREAVSRLRNAGLLEPRQGLGVFVLPPRLEPLDLSPSSKDKVLQVVEVRRALEAEAAALAAERATADDVSTLRVALTAVDAAVGGGGDGVDEDLRLHRFIADATHNPYIVATLSYLGQVMRSSIQITRANEARRRDFIEQVRAEHSAIVEAIAESDPAQAESAARTHMHHAAERLQDADERFWGTP